MACEVLAGARIPYPERAERCYGVRPAEVPEEAFEAAHERLGAALGGTGPLRERYARWSAAQRVPPELVVPALDALLAGLGARTREQFALPEGERVELEIVEGRPWIAFAEYEGGLRSRISVNRDVPATASRLLDIALHEVYPGHHTEHVLKDGHPGHAAFVYPTQQALISEGIAMYAREALLGDAVGAECLRPLGISYDAEVAAVDAEVWTALAPVRVNLHPARRRPRRRGRRARVRPPVARRGRRVRREGGARHARRPRGHPMTAATRRGWRSAARSASASRMASGAC